MRCEVGAIASEFQFQSETCSDSTRGTAGYGNFCLSQRRIFHSLGKWPGKFTHT